MAVVVAGAGYPGSPRTGDEVIGAEQDGILHAGTVRGEDGVVRSSGGRILACTGVGPDLAEARARAYQLVRSTTVDGSHHRTDIASAAAARQ